MSFLLTRLQYANAHTAKPLVHPKPPVTNVSSLLLGSGCDISMSLILFLGCRGWVTSELNACEERQPQGVSKRGDVGRSFPCLCVKFSSALHLLVSLGHQYLVYPNCEMLFMPVDLIMMGTEGTARWCEFGGKESKLNVLSQWVPKVPSQLNTMRARMVPTEAGGGGRTPLRVLEFQWRCLWQGGLPSSQAEAVYTEQVTLPSFLQLSNDIYFTALFVMRIQ